MTSSLLLTLLPIATAGDDFELKPTGFVRPSFVWLADDPDTASADKASGSTLLSDRDSFAVAARIGFKGKFNPLNLESVVDADFLPTFTVRDAWVAVRPVGPLTITAGQHKTPISAYQMSSDTRRLLPIAPRIIGATGYGREMGAKLDLRIPVEKKVRGTLTAGIYNGEGASKTTNENQEFLYALRGMVTPLGARDGWFEGTDRETYLGIGASYFSNLKGGDTTVTYIASGATEPMTAEERNITGEKSGTFGIDGQFAWRWLSLQAEYLTTTVTYADTSKTGVKIAGFYAQGGFFIPVDPIGRHLEFVLRYESSDPNSTICETSDGVAVADCVAENAELGWRDTGSTARPLFQAANVVTIGTNVYFDAKAKNFHQFKAQLAYSMGMETEGEDLASDGKISDSMIVVLGSVAF